MAKDQNMDLREAIETVEALLTSDQELGAIGEASLEQRDVEALEVLIRTAKNSAPLSTARMLDALMDATDLEFLDTDRVALATTAYIMLSTYGDLLNLQVDMKAVAKHWKVKKKDIRKHLQELANE